MRKIIFLKRFIRSIRFARGEYERILTNLCVIMNILFSLILGGCDDPLAQSVQLINQQGTLIDFSNSTLIATAPYVRSNGIETSTLILTLKDAKGAPLVGKQVRLVSSRGSLIDQLSPVSVDTTNPNGVVSFTIKSTVAGKTILTATDISDQINLSPIPATINFYSDQFVFFKIQGLNSNLSPGIPSAFNVIVSDSNGNNLTNYNGTIYFSSDDLFSTLPSPYTFTTDDRGIKTFSVTFSSSGMRKLMITDYVNNISFVQSNIPVDVNISITSPSSGQIFPASSANNIYLYGSCSEKFGPIDLTLTDGSIVITKATTCSNTLSPNWVVSLDATHLKKYLNLTVSQLDLANHLTSTASVDFINGNDIPSSDQSTILVTPVSLTSDNSSVATITVSLKNSLGVPVSTPKSVSLTSSSSNTTLSSANPAKTNSQGMVSYQVKTKSSDNYKTIFFIANDMDDSVTLSGQGRLFALPLSPTIDFQARLFDRFTLGSNDSQTNYLWKNLSSTDEAFDMTLLGFTFPTSASGSGWFGVGSSSDPNRLTFDGQSSVVNGGNKINNFTNISFETWINPSSSSSDGSVIFSNGDLNGHGLTLKQSRSSSNTLQLTLGFNSYSDLVLQDAAAPYWRMNITSSSSTLSDTSSAQENLSVYSTSDNLMNALSSQTSALKEYNLAGYFPGYLYAASQDSISFKAVEIWVRSFSKLSLPFFSGFDGDCSNQDRNRRFIISTYVGGSLQSDYNGDKPDWDQSKKENGIYINFMYNDLIIPYNTIFDGKFHHIVVSLKGGSEVVVGIDGTFPSGYTYDGSSYTSATQSSTSSFYLANGAPISDSSSDTILLGRGCGLGGGTSKSYFSGYLDEIALYPSPLSQVQIVKHFNAGSVATCNYQVPSNYTNHWHLISGYFNQNSGNSTLSLYVDGAQRCVLSALASSYTYIGSTNYLGLGAGFDYYTNTGIRDTYWSGSILNLFFYNSIRSFSDESTRYSSFSEFTK